MNEKDGRESLLIAFMVVVFALKKPICLEMKCHYHQH
ncbi:hypothetical protein BVRB_2g029300 [Beta vulgaris subsp. vulgaris]|nr:hypothetical protein BVRB_2g029300 [Beta vulgaris subsp. vulgaris]